MTKLELRVIDYDQFDSPAFWELLQTTRPDVVSFGSESCYLQLPALHKLTEILSKLEEFDTKFVVPMLFESQFDKVTPLIDHAVGRVRHIAVNDYGALHYLRRRHSGAIDRVSLSSGLSYSYEQCPWHGHIVREQSEAVKQSMLRSNLDNAWIWEFLKEYPFAFEVELPALPGMVRSVTELKRQGFRVSLLADAVPVSCARACHAARYFGVTPENCGRVCRAPAKLETTHRWDFFQADVKEIDPAIREQMPELSVWGNMIYIPNSAASRAKATHEVDSVIFDMKFYSDLHVLADAMISTRAVSPSVESHKKMHRAPITEGYLP